MTVCKHRFLRGRGSARYMWTLIPLVILVLSWPWPGLIGRLICGLNSEVLASPFMSLGPELIFITWITHSEVIRPIFYAIYYIVHKFCLWMTCWHGAHWITEDLYLTRLSTGIKCLSRLLLWRSKGSWLKGYHVNPKPKSWHKTTGNFGKGSDKITSPWVW